MFRAGLTGGIGSGKTTVARVFEILGIPVYNADKEAKQLMHTDQEVVYNLRQAFGNEIFNATGLDRKRISKIVFNNPDKLRTLNSIVHPAVIRHFYVWAEQQKAPYVLKEAALLFEAGTYTDCGAVITVTAPVDLRIRRVMARDQVTADEVMSRIRNQWPEDEKIRRSNYVIQNDDKTLISPQVLHIHNKLLFKIRGY
jgi:dephospho-CoA kinase